MKKRICLCVSLILCAFFVRTPLTVSADEGGYVIRDYQVSAVVHEDRTVDVKEIIQVDFTQERHGIYRYIPETMSIKTDVPGKDGAVRQRTLHYQNSVEDIRVDGWKYQLSSEDGNRIVTIGDEKKTVEGLQTYELSYRYRYPEDRLDGKDFFFHSVLGANWDAQIDRFSFQVSFDKPLPEEAQKNLLLYSGEFGAQANQLGVVCQVTDAGIFGEATDIAERKAVTIYMELPEGYFLEAEKASPLPCNIFAAIAAAAALIALAKVLFTPKKTPEERAEYYPPGDISSAEVGIIIDESADSFDLCSLIPWWAQKRYLRIEEIPDEKGRDKKHAKLRLIKTGELPFDAPEYQTELFGALFEDGEEVCLSDLPSSFANKFESARKKLAQGFKGEKKLSTGWAAAGICLTVISLSFGTAFCISSRVSLSYNVPVGILSAVLLGGAGLCRLAQRPKDAFRSRQGWILGYVLLAVLFAANAVVVYIGLLDDTFLPKAVWVIGFLIAFAASVLCAEMIQPTAYRLDMMGRLLGLKRFMETADRTMLQTLETQDPEYYYQLLPFAIVFELSDKWAEQFRDMCVTAPDWYCGSDLLLTYNTIYLHEQLMYGVNQSIHDVQVASASSGGFSGGGGGGGGGGSW